MTLDPRPDAVVIGAGIVGAACAASLARRGLRVLVLESRYAAGVATAAGMGHVTVMDDSPAQLALTAYSGRLWRDLATSLPDRVEWDPCGTLWIAEDEEQLLALSAKGRRYREHGVHAEMLAPAELQAAEPHLQTDLAGALLVPGDVVVYPPTAALALLDIARDHGASLRERCEVQSVADHTVFCDGEVYRAEVIVNAAGAEAARLAPALDIVPRKGHLVITDRAPGFCRHQLVEVGYLTSAHTMTTESVAFNVQPRRTGQLLIGSSRELVGWDRTLNHRVLNRMLERASRFMPALSRLSALRSWTGFRPSTPDKLPYVGPCDETAGLWVNAGHEGLGITMSLGSAELLADLATGRRPEIDPAPFLPARLSSSARAG